MPTIDEENIIKSDQRTPNVAELSDALLETIADLGGLTDQMKDNYDIRHNIWNGQSKDGRKHGTSSNPAFPWDGASDLRPFITDEVINNDVDLLTDAVMKANFSAIPVGSNDIRRARLVSSFMRWMVHSQIKEMHRETEILANYFLEKGFGMIGAFWERKVDKSRKKLTLEEISQSSPEFVTFIQDPELDMETAEMLRQWMPDLKQRPAKRMVKELREQGFTDIPITVVTYNRPRIRAYTIDEDIFFPINTHDFQDAPYIFTSEYFTASELRNKVATDGWDEKWVDAVIDKTLGNDFSTAGTLTHSSREYARQVEFGFDKNTNLVRVATAWERATDEDGIPGIWLTVFHPDIEGFGKFELFNYDPVRYPFIPFCRERRTRRLLDTRGVPEICQYFQDEIKVQRDSRVDRTAMATCPPRRHPVGRPPKNWGPGTLLAERREGEYGFVQAPTGGINESVEIEQAIRNSMDEYFGRPNPNNDPIAAQTKKQAMVNRFLGGFSEVIKQLFSLHSQFGPEEEFFRVVGEAPEEEQLDRYVKSNNAEQYDFYLDYNILNQDGELKLNQIKEIGQLILQYDQTGQADMGKYLQKAIASIDPTLGDEVIIPQQAAQMKEIEKTQEDLTKISAGFDVNPPENSNAELRMQIVQNYMQGSEEVPAHDIQERLQNDELFAGRLENYMKKLQFQLQQRENAEIGRRGGKPGNAVPS